MTPPELKPCPFCGGPAEIQQYGDNRKSTIVACTECACVLENGEAFRHGTIWNTRAHDPALAAKDAEINRLREALDQCEDYFDNRADAEYFTDSPTPVPNEEMTLLAVVRAALEASK